MTEKEALDIISQSIEWEIMVGDKYWNSKQMKALKVAKEVLEKQIPKDTIEVNEECPPCCPVCEQVAVGKYCWNCGQRLNWGDDE